MADRLLEELVYKIWKKQDLDIIPKAIIPIEIWYENKNRHVGEIDFEVKPHLRGLQKLYDDAPD